MSNVEFWLTFCLSVSVIGNLILLVVLKSETGCNSDRLASYVKVHVELSDCQRELKQCRHDLTLP